MRPARVLLVDDRDRTLSSALADALGEHEVETANDAFDAIYRPAMRPEPVHRAADDGACDRRPRFSKSRRMMVVLTRCSVVALLGLATACAAEYTYVPRPGIEEPMGNRVAADYAIPPEAPRGELQVVSYGIVHVASEAAPDKYLHALHLRVIVRNDSDQPWTLDTREQRLELDGRGQSAPAFASANPGAPPPLVTIPPSGRRVVDLFFPLPADLEEASELPAFDAIWRVDVGAQAVIERTPFERLQSEPAEYETYDYGYDYYWGPPYWYNPLYPEFTFFGPVWVAPELRGPPVTIRHERGHHFEPRGGRPPHEGSGSPPGGGGGGGHGGSGPHR